jgi:hypothetical protein
MSIIKKRIEKILNSAQEQLSKLADGYRTRVLLPICRKHRLTYIAGMGRTVFYIEGDESRSIGDGAEASLLGYGKVLSKVFDDLNEPVLSSNDVFGYYVGDISEKDIGF